MSLVLSRLWITRSNYDFGPSERELGIGTYGRVVEATDRNTGKRVAVKFLFKKINDQSQERSFLRELEILASNSHPATLRLLGFGIDQRGLPMVVTDLMPNGTLENVLRNEHRGRDNPEWNATRKSICVFGICAAMAHLHAQGIVHRDLKPGNVFLNENWEPVVADFGLSRRFEPGLEQTLDVGTPRHMAPEVYNGDSEYGFPVDVYSFAVLLYSFFAEATELNDGQGPAKSGTDLVRRAAAGARFVKPRVMLEAYWTLIEVAWCQEPDQRPPFQAIVKDFHDHHDYIFPGADFEQVVEYENRILTSSASLAMRSSLSILTEGHSRLRSSSLGVSPSGDLMRPPPRRSPGGGALSRAQSLPSGRIRRTEFTWDSP
jgi:serine/threonine protein kinase